MPETYSHEWFDAIAGPSKSSANAVVPAVMDLLPVQSVIDIGCGTGAWLAAFRNGGVKDLAGVDGDYVDRSRLLFPPELFISADLTRPPDLSRRFDLATCLEVAEHLPEEHADRFVSWLCSLAPVVLFSAAIPHQGGNDHLNEQWPDYWEARFAQHGYEPVDCLRMRYWNDRRVEWYYAQNMVLFVERTKLASYPALATTRRAQPGQLARLVHPQRYLLTARLCDFGLRKVLKSLPSLFLRAIRGRLRSRPR